MKLTALSKISALLSKAIPKGWTINALYTWHRTYRIYLLPSIEFVTYKTQWGPSANPFVPEFDSLEYRLEMSFLTAHYDVYITKRTKI